MLSWLKILKYKINEIKYMIGVSSVLSSSAAKNSFKDLWDAEVRVYSQWGEDGILNYLHNSIGIAKPKILEVGAGNFTECNSRFAAEFRNASVYAVDMREDLRKKVEESPLYWRNNLFCEEIFVTTENANSILQRAMNSMNGIDTLSLDLDGNDYWILDVLKLNGVKIVVCEYNPLFGSKFAITVPVNNSFDRTQEHFSWLYYGMSLKAAIKVMKSKGFTFIGTNRVGSNAFFLSNDCVEKFELEVPDQSSLEKFIDWRVREGRNKNGELSYLTQESAKLTIGDCIVQDIESSTLYKIKELN